MRPPDYYAVLGVEEHADEATLRSAYRRLCREHHPDLGDDKEARTERMVQLNAAWEVLGDAEKRAEYDRARQRRRHWDMFDSLFGRPPERTRGADVHRTVVVSFLDTIRGCTAKVIAARGVGYVEVKLPAGVERDARLRCAGLGEPGSPPGDLFVRVAVERDTGWLRRDGEALYMNLPLTWAEAYRGGELQVATPWTARTFIQLPGRPLESGEQLELAGHGVRRFAPDGGLVSAGPLFLVVELVAPPAGDTFVAMALNAAQAASHPRSDLEHRLRRTS